MSRNDVFNIDRAISDALSYRFLLGRNLQKSGYMIDVTVNPDSSTTIIRLRHAWQRAVTMRDYDVYHEILAVILLKSRALSTGMSDDLMSILAGILQDVNGKPEPDF